MSDFARFPIDIKLRLAKNMRVPRPDSDYVRAVQESIATAAVRLGLGGFQSNRPTDALLTLDVCGAADFKDLSLGQLRRSLYRTLGGCREIREHYPHLEQPYRLRRRWLAASALTLASGRLLASSRALLAHNAAPGDSTVRPRITPLLAASSLGFWRGGLDAALAAAPRKSRYMDDACVHGVLASLAAAERVVLALDQENQLMEERRRAWRRLEVHGSTEPPDHQQLVRQATKELLWACPTRISVLILLSTLRDNNTGIYRHPDLSRRFGPETVSHALGCIHRETCEELLDYPFQEVVRELELYANQSRADEVSFLNNWRTIRAYRTARPAGLDLFSACLFEFTFDLAVAALDSRKR